jgi:hypothetical protein
MILVSAGHYEEAQGAEWNGRFEHPEMLKWRDLLVQYLGDVGQAVPAGPLEDKVDFINAAQGVYCLELHMNSAKVDGKPVGRGHEVLYYRGSTLGRELAGYINLALSKFFSPDRGIKEGTFHMSPGGPPLYFLQKTHAPSAIAEIDFVHRFDLIAHQRSQCCMEIARQLLILLEKKGLM